MDLDRCALKWYVLQKDFHKNAYNSFIYISPNQTAQVTISMNMDK